MESYDRTFGLLEMSIPTSLAIEGFTFTGEYSDRTGIPPVELADELWVNIRTLARNAVRSFPAKELSLSSKRIITDAVLEDIDKIKYIMDEFPTIKKVVFYHTSDDDWREAFPNAESKVLRGKTALLVANLCDSACEKVLEKDKDIIKFNLVPTPINPRRCVMLTHLPMDLLPHRDFESLKLLESHSGAVKDFNHWHTKLASLPKGSVVPFDALFLQIFGDGNLIAPQPIKLRRLILDIAEKRGWSTTTTKSKIEIDIKLENNKDLIKVYKELKVNRFY